MWLDQCGIRGGGPLAKISTSTSVAPAARSRRKTRGRTESRVIRGCRREAREEEKESHARQCLRARDCGKKKKKKKNGRERFGSSCPAQVRIVTDGDAYVPARLLACERVVQARSMLEVSLHRALPPSLELQSFAPAYCPRRQTWQDSHRGGRKRKKRKSEKKVVFFQSVHCMQEKRKKKNFFDVAAGP